MPWILARTTDLTDDPEWRGVLGKAAPPAAPPTAPAAGDMFAINAQGGASLVGGQIEVRVGWLDANDSPVTIAGTCTIQLVTLDTLPMNDSKEASVFSMDEQATVNTTGWAVTPVRARATGRAIMRLTGMVAAGATQAVVWYWRAP